MKYNDNDNEKRFFSKIMYLQQCYNISSVNKSKLGKNRFMKSLIVNCILSIILFQCLIDLT